jgi:hypothetical protein
MNSDFLEKVVSNIFTNLLHTENQLTTAKVQAIAETSVHYAFILKDTYDRVVFEKLMQNMNKLDVEAKEDTHIHVSPTGPTSPPLEPKLQEIKEVVKEILTEVVKEKVVAPKVEVKKQVPLFVEEIEDDDKDEPVDNFYIKEEDFEDIEDIQVKKPKVKPVEKTVTLTQDAPVKRPRGRQKGWSPKNKKLV